MDVMRLRTFVAVADELHFGRAAERLHLAQQAVSDHVRRLERDLDVELFHRTTRSVELSRAGEALLSDGKRLLADAEAVRSRVHAVGAGRSGLCRIAYDPVAIPRVLPDVLHRIRKAMPGVDIILEETCPPDLETHVRTGRVDAAIAGPASDLTALDHEQLAVDHPVVLLPAGHPQAGRHRVALADVEAEPFVGYERGSKSGADELMGDLLTRAGITPATVHRASSELAVAGLVAAGCGVGIVTGHAAAALALPVVAAHTEPTMDLPIWLVWDADRTVKGAGPTRRLRDVLTSPA